LILLDDFLDNTDGDGLFHISNGESSEGRVLIEGFNDHWFLGYHSNEGSFSRLEELGLFFKNFTRSSINLAFEFVEFASDVSSVAIEDGSVTLLDLTGVIQDDDLSEEVGGILAWVVL